MSFQLLRSLGTLPASHKLFRRGEIWINAGQVRSAARHLATALSGRPGDIVLHTGSLSAFAAGLLGARIAGRDVVLPAHDGAEYLRTIGDGLPLVGDQASRHPEAIRICIPDDAKADANVDWQQARDLGLTFYTSGSTAEPKPVHKSIRQLDDEAEILARLWPGVPLQTVMSTVPHHHIYGLLFRLFLPVRINATSHDDTYAYWETIAARMSGGDPAVLVSSPAHLGRIPDGVTCRPAMVFSSGGPLPHVAASASFRALGTWPVEVLGSTESGGVGWRTQQDGNALWQPLPEVDVSLSAAGELQVRSPHADGDAMCILGDHGVLADDGRFMLQGRIGPVVKIEGVRVSTVRVEETIAALTEVASCRTLMVPGSGHDRLAAVVVLTDPGLERLALEGPFRLGRTLRHALAGQLSAAERPRLWRFVGSLPMNTQGKVTMEALLGLFDRPSPRGDELPLTGIAVTGDEATARLRLAGDMLWFDGHFPGQPILPGIAQVHVAMRAAQQIWQWQPDGANLMKLKFKRVVRPDEEVTLHLHRDMAKGFLRFRFECEGIETSSGRIGGRG